MPRRRDRPSDEVIEAELRSGLSVNAVRRKHGIAHEVVDRVRERIGLPKGPLYRLVAWSEAIAADLRSGLSVNAVRRKHGTSFEIVDRIRIKLGLPKGQSLPARSAVPEEAIAADLRAGMSVNAVRRKHGIGWKTADRIRKRIGAPKQLAPRARKRVKTYLLEQHQRRESVLLDLVERRPTAAAEDLTEQLRLRRARIEITERCRQQAREEKLERLRLLVPEDSVPMRGVRSGSVRLVSQLCGGVHAGA